MIPALIIFILFWILNRHLFPRFVWLAQLLLIVSPWFIQLLISPLEFHWLTQPATSLSAFLRNLALYSSDEFVFFAGDRRLGFGTQEFGLVYLSWLPLWLVGLVQSLSRPPAKYISWWLGLGILAASLFTPTAPFSAGLLYIPAVQVLTSFGLIHLLTHFRRYPLWLRLGLILLCLFSLYEVLNFFHVLAVHYPQRIHEAVTSKL